MENAWNNLNNQLLNLAGVFLAQKEREKDRNLQNLNVLMGLGNQMGITPESYQEMQGAAAKAGIKFPDMQAQQQQTAIDPMQSLLGQVPNSPLQPQQPLGLSVEEEQIVGPARKYQEFADEVATEMGVNPNNLIGGEPLKKFRQESFMRYRSYLKERESTLRSLAIENRKEKRQLTLEDKRWKEREALEDKKEAARRKAQLESERIGDERQAAALAASDKKQARALAAAEKNTRIREEGSERRLNKRESYIEGRFERRLSERKSEFQQKRADKSSGVVDKKKLITIYGPGGRTKMVPVSASGEYEPPQGWSLEKPSKEEKQLQQILGGSVGAKKVPVYDIKGNLLRYE